MSDGALLAEEKVPFAQSLAENVASGAVADFEYGFKELRHLFLQVGWSFKSLKVLLHVRYFLSQQGDLVLTIRHIPNKFYRINNILICSQLEHLTQRIHLQKYV